MRLLRSGTYALSSNILRAFDSGRLCAGKKLSDFRAFMISDKGYRSVSVFPIGRSVKGMGANFSQFQGHFQVCVTSSLRRESQRIQNAADDSKSAPKIAWNKQSGTTKGSVMENYKHSTRTF
jgi:hypothetical protein